MKNLVFFISLLALSKSNSSNRNDNAGKDCNSLIHRYDYIPNASIGEIYIEDRRPLTFFVPIIKGRTFSAESDNKNLIFEEISGFICGARQYFEVSCRGECYPGDVFTFELTENLPGGVQTGLPAEVCNYIAVVIGDQDEI